MYNYCYPKGRFLAHGFFFDDRIPLESIQQKVLELWSQDTQLYKTDYGFVIILAQAVPCFIEEVFGAPLIRQFGAISNVLWQSVDTLPERKTANPFWLLQQGECVELSLSADKFFDPSLWLDLTNYVEIKMLTLGSIGKPAFKDIKTNVSVRDVLNEKSLDESLELTSVLKKLEDVKLCKEVTERKGGGRLSAFFFGFKSLFNASSSTRDDSERNKGRGGGSLNAPGGDSNGFFARIKSAFSHMVLASALGRVIGRTQAKYVQKLMDQLANGDVEDALKNAIPLSNLQDALNSKGASLGGLRGRVSTSINPFRHGSSSSVSLDGEVLTRLRSMYETAFTRLDRMGNYKKAAFILAELLRDIDRAVAYLEEHKQFGLAAELAEGQKLQPSRVIRQWILADDIGRAMQVAVVSGCYEEAITALEKDHLKEANSLRWHVAHLHYQAGNINSAVDIGWPISERRDQVIQWLKESYQHGGAIGARHLVRLALHDAENYTHYLGDINKIFQSNSKINSLAVYDEVIKNGELKANKRIASIASRSYLLDVARGEIKHDSKRWNRLCCIAGDLTLRADARNLSFNSIVNKTPLSERDNPVELQFEKSYGRSSLDCARLHNGQILIAFGESGVELWSLKGRRLHSFSVPCHSLVVSDSGGQVLFVGQRSGYQVISKFDARSLKAQHWMDVELSCWAESYDGIRWIVGHNDSVFALSLSSTEQLALWRVGDLKGFVQSIVRTPHYFAFCLASEEQFELWTYQLPNLFLKERTPYQQQNLNNMQPVTYREDGWMAGFNAEFPTQFGVYQEKTAINWVALDLEAEVESLTLIQDYLAVQCKLDDSVSIHLCPVLHSKVRDRVLSLEFEGYGEVMARRFDTQLLVSHASGRIIVVDLEFAELSVEFVV